MTLQKVIALSWIVSVFVSIVFAVDRKQPIAAAFMPIKNIKAFCLQLVLVVWISLLAVLQLYGCPELLGQQPMTWGFMMATVYAWICLGAYIGRAR